jgi:hypothetical protein
MCTIVFGQIKLRYSPKMRWYIFVPLMLKVDVLIPAEVQMDVSLTPELK